MIDEKDQLILEELSKDARLPTKRIATNLDIPRVTVHTRIEKMKDEGVIKKFTVHRDYKKVGLPVTAYVFIEFTHIDNKITQKDIGEKIAKVVNVYEVQLISGEWDILVKIRGKTLEEIGRIVLEEIRPIRGVSKTITCPSFNTIKEEI